MSADEARSLLPNAARVTGPAARWTRFGGGLVRTFGRGEKVHKSWDCLPCYLPQCARSPNCMEALSAEDVFAAVRRRIASLSAVHA